jgi:arginine repressor
MEIIVLKKLVKEIEKLTKQEVEIDIEQAFEPRECNVLDLIKIRKDKDDYMYRIFKIINEI